MLPQMAARETSRIESANRQERVRANRATMNRTQSKRFASFERSTAIAELLECGCFSTAFGPGFMESLLSF